MKKIKPALWMVLFLIMAAPLIVPRIRTLNTGQGPEKNLLLGTLTSNQQDPKWVTLASGPQNIARLGLDDDQLQLTMPGFYLEPVLLGQRPACRVSLPGHIMVQREGLPEVPVLSRSIRLNPGDKVTLKIVQHTTRHFKVDPVQPSLGHLSRNEDPSRVTPRFDDFYQSQDIFPSKVIELGPVFTLREQEGVNIRVYPLRYDAGKGQLLVTEKLLVDIIIDNPAGYSKTITAQLKPGTQEFGTVYQQVFGEMAATNGADKYNAPSSRGRMLIITPGFLAPSLQEFVAWKQQLGIPVMVNTTEEIGGTSAAIATRIADLYKEPDGLTWVILVGDKEELPPGTGGFDGSDSDSKYAQLTGADIYPDVYISRISAGNPTQLLTQVNKFIAYEKHPATGSEATWYRQGIGIASDEGNPTDTERAELLRSALLDYGFQSVAGIYQGQGGYSRDITDAVNRGASIVNYLGHGSGTSWGSVYFSITQVHALENGPRWPWIVDVSCSNGDFALDECLAESWLRAGSPEQPQGAVGIISSTSLAPWVPPTVMQKEIIDLLTSDRTFTLGGMFYSGLMKVVDEYTGVSVAEQVVDQNVVFGDCSLMVRTAVPDDFQVSGPQDLSSSALTWSGQITGPAGSVATLTWDGVLYGVGLVGDAGNTDINLTTPLTQAPQLRLTVSGYNMVPYQSLLTIDGGGLTDPDPEPDPEPQTTVNLPPQVELKGNFPNPFNPSTRIAFDLPREMHVSLTVYDIRGNLVKRLVNENLGAGHQEVVWNGTNRRGEGVSSGVYLYRLETPEGAQSARMTVSK